MPRNDEAELLARWNLMRQQRRPHESPWFDIWDQQNPYRGTLDTVESQLDADTRIFYDDDTRMTRVYDTTGMNALHELVNFIKGQIFPNNVDWLSFDAPQDLEDDVEIRTLYHKTGTRILRGLADSNFYMASTPGLRDLLSIGNECTAVQESSPKRQGAGNTFGGGFFNSISMERVWWQLDQQGNVLFMVVQYDMPTRDAFDFFETPGRAVMDQLRSGKTMKMVRYLNFVFPNENPVVGGIRSATDKPWVSKWMLIQEGANEIMQDGGFEQNLYTRSGWDPIANSEYFAGLGHISRPDIAGVNAGTAQVLLSIGRDLNPRLMVEHEMVIQVADPGPGGTLVVRNPKRFPPQYLQSSTDYTAANDVFDKQREQIRRVYLADLLQNPDAAERSAEAVIDRQGRTLARIASLAEVIEHQYLKPKVEAFAGLMFRAGALPEFEEIVARTGRGVGDLKFTSPFFTIQRAQTVQEDRAFIQHMLEIVGATQDLSVLDGIDFDEYRDNIAKVTGVSATILRNDSDIAARRAARARQAALQQTIAAQQGQTTREAVPA
jgi:hypothetical protein